MFYNKRENFIEIYTFPLAVVLCNQVCFEPCYFNLWDFFFLEDLFAPNNLLAIWWFHKLPCLIPVKRLNILTNSNRLLCRLTASNDLMITDRILNLNSLP